MRFNNFLSALLVVIGLLSCNRQAIKKNDLLLTDSISISDPVDPIFRCGFGMDSSHIIQITDSKLKHPIKGLVKVKLEFSDLSSLKVNQLEIKSIYLKVNNEIKILNRVNDDSNSNIQFQIYELDILSLIQSCSCWYQNSDSRYISSNKIVYNFPLIISNN